MNVCDRCPARAECLLDYGGKNCKRLAKSYGFDPAENNHERIDNLSDEGLAEFLAQWAEKHLAWMRDSGAVLSWLKENRKEK